MSERFTEEELAIAKNVDLVAVAERLGFTPKKVGNCYTLKEMDSVRIFHRRTWYRFSRPYETGENGGSQIDFVKVFGGLDIKDAVFWLLDFAGYQSRDKKDVTLKNMAAPIVLSPGEDKTFLLPEANFNNDLLYSYLMNERGLSKEVVDFFVDKGLIYESFPYHNIVFKGNDKEGKTRFASMRGVFDKQGRPFKGDVAGNNKNYGFNVVNKDSPELVVFEAAIDLMSYVEILNDYTTNKLALGMLHDAPLETFLNENPNIGRIRFCLDNDLRGRNASEHLMEKYYGYGYEVEDYPAPQGYKDINEWMVDMKMPKMTKASHWCR